MGGEIQPRNIETGEIDPVVNTVVIGIVFEKCIVPRFELMAEHQIQFQMDMCACLI